MPTLPPFNKAVFINCPFDPKYTPLFEAIIFTVFSLGFAPRCSKEIDDGGVRINRVIRIIGECRYGIHDISRTQLDEENRLPRFNMPLELGIDMGCRYLSSDKQHKRKSQLILDKDQYRFQKFISDIAGQDPKAHQNKPKEVIKLVRNWLKTSSGKNGLPAAAFVQSEYARFRRDLRRISKTLGFDEIPYADYCGIVSDWLKKRKAKLARKPAGRGKMRKR